MTRNEPEIRQEDILVVQDEQFQNDNVCIVTGAGREIGRETAIAAAVNGLMAVGLDINEEEGKKTQKFARYLVGGDLLFDGGVVLTY